MKVESTFQVKGRGTVACVTLGGPEPALGSTLRRDDGAEWVITGVEWWAIPRRPGKGDSVGLLLRDGGQEIREGDEVCFV